MIALACLSNFAIGQEVRESWTAFYPDPNASPYYASLAMALDHGGNVYVTGTEGAPGDPHRLVTIKYDFFGNRVWTAFYGPEPEPLFPSDLKVDREGNVFLAAASSNNAFIIKYDSKGNQILKVTSTNLSSWVLLILPQNTAGFTVAGLPQYTTLAVEHYDGAGRLLSVMGSPLNFDAERFIIDQGNNIVVGGTGHDTNFIQHIYAAKYNSSGSLLWKATPPGPGDLSNLLGGLNVDAQGNVFVTGASYNHAGKTFLIKYDKHGTFAWLCDLGLFGIPPRGVVEDASGNSFVTLPDFALCKCSPNGTLLWETQSTPMRGSDFGFSVSTLDKEGNIYLAGGLSLTNSSGISRVTLKFDNDGHELWTETLSAPADSLNTSQQIKIDDWGEVVVAGTSIDTNLALKYVTTKYSQAKLAGIPLIRRDPQSVRATAFTTVTFAISATGDKPMSYQWGFNGQPIPGATKSFLTIPNAPERSAGVYFVVASNHLGWTKSRDATLRLDIPPVIDEQPIPRRLAQGEMASLSVSAHGALPLTFQWQHNGKNIAGATTGVSLNSGVRSSLVLTNVSLADQGAYRVVISNAFGMTTSAAAQVTLLPQVGALWISNIIGPVPDWNYRFPLTARDRSGNIHVSACVSDARNNSDYLTIKLDPTGHQLWSARYEGAGGDDVATDMVLDQSGNVYVTGNSQGPDGRYAVTTVKYDDNGNQLWVARDAGPNGTAVTAANIAVDESGNVIASGMFFANDSSFYMVTKHDADGKQLWQAFAELSIYAMPYGLALDTQGNVLVTGYGGTIKFSPAGNELWRSGPSYGEAVKTDSEDNIYVLTSVYRAGTPGDFGVEKYDGNGRLLWSSPYAGYGNVNDYPASFSVGKDGSVYVGGVSAVGGSSDYITVRLNPDGQVRWAARYSEGTDSYSYLSDITIDELGDAYVTGTSPHSGFGSLTTVKYDAEGNQRWVAHYSNLNGVMGGNKIMMANQTNVIVTGIIRNSGGSLLYTAIEYAQTNISGLPTVVSPPRGQMVFVNSNVVLNVTGNGGPLRYQWRHFGTNIPGATHATLAINHFQPKDGGDYSVIMENKVDITITPEARLTPYTQLSSPAVLSPCQFCFTLTGEPNRFYDVQQSSDLLTWVSLTNLFSANGVVGFTDYSATNGVKTFYRAKKFP